MSNTVYQVVLVYLYCIQIESTARGRIPLLSYRVTVQVSSFRMHVLCSSRSIVLIYFSFIIGMREAWVEYLAFVTLATTVQYSRLTDTCTADNS